MLCLQRAKLTVLAQPFERLASWLVGYMLEHASSLRLASGPNVSVHIPQSHPGRGVAMTIAYRCGESQNALS